MIKKNKTHIKKFMFFGIVGAIGTIINTALLYFLTFSVGIYYLVSSLIATEVAIISNFFGNNMFTFKDRNDKSPLVKRFMKFQFISIGTVIGTVFLLWFFTTVFGESKLILWNFAAILVMFVANFALNNKYTWKSKSLIIIFSILLINFSSAALVSTNQMGYHSNMSKQVIVYTSSNSGNFTIYSMNGTHVYSGQLVKAKDYNQNSVECQGNNPCLVGDFSNFTVPGDYIISTSFNGTDPLISIRDDVYSDNIDTFFEFFNAQKQQGSNYHGDMHSGYNPEFITLADGSFLMESHQASKTLIRLGSSYNRNPSLFDNKIRDTIKDYVQYLEGLQGLVVVEMDPSNESYDSGFRLNYDVKINNIFVPGPTNITSMDIYIPGSQHTVSDHNVEVVSLCGSYSGNQFNECVNHAAEYYKCQIDEPCVNASYIENTGKVIAKSGYGVSRGWSTEFGCYFDVTLQPIFNNQTNPCLVFKPEQSREDTVMALLGFLESLPALYDSDPGYATRIFDDAYETNLFILSNYSSFSPNDEDAGYYGASLFLLYDYTGNSSYLEQAYSMRDFVTPSVSSVFISDGTRGSEFYWEEYANHKNDLISLNLPYPYQGKTPEDMFQDKIFFDWKDAGPTRISNNAERVFQFDNNIRFQNSRYILTEGLLATKTLDLNNNPQSFTKQIADNEISWMTGMNAIQEGTGQNAPVRSYSFIFGIAPSINPNQFHSRYLIDSGFRTSTNGQIVGTRGSGKQFFNGTDYVYLDGTYELLGNNFGSFGNEYNGEPQRNIWNINRSFSNGKTYIPGWINGAFDIPDNEPDTIFNYDDDVGTYEFTETTNEIVSTAIEYFSYLDAYYNNKSDYGQLHFLINNSNNNNNNSNNSNTGGSSNKIVGNWSNIVFDWSEDRKAIFNVTLNSSGVVNWTLNGDIINTTGPGIEHSFSWTPDLFYTSNRENAVISAQLGNESISWEFEVNNLINPFFDPSTGNSGSTIHVFTNGNLRRYSNISVGIQGVEGSNVITRIYSLNPHNASNNETDWSMMISDSEFNFGNNYLSFINATSNGVNYYYQIPTSGQNIRAFYKPTLGSSGGSGGGSSGGSSGGGGGGGGSRSETLDLIYVTLENNVISTNEDQKINLDAKSNLNVRNVKAYFAKTDGSLLAIPLELTNGNGGYGTWSSTFSVNESGLYTLSFVEIDGQSKAQNFSVSNRAFYAVSNTVNSNERLMIIYTALDASTVDKASNVGFTLDARDFIGVKEINALINKKHGDDIENFTIDVELISGDEKYGTWKGYIPIDQGDTTYSVVQVTLSDNNATKVYEINNRSVYATSDIKSKLGNKRSLITGGVINELLSKPLNTPFFPFIFASFIVLVVIIGIIAKSKIKKIRNKSENIS